MSEVGGRAIGDNQLAQGFVWRLEEVIPNNGYIGLILPAMTLFETKCKSYRKDFFRTFQVDSVANFSNLAEVLFGGRSRVPAAAFFYRPRIERGSHDSAVSSVAVYAPLVANQEATRPTKDATRNESWSLVVNASEVRRLPLEDIAEGEGLPWKLATWGSHLDDRLLRRLKHRFDSFEKLEDKNVLILSEGPQLKDDPVKKGPNKTTYCAEVVGKNTLDMRVLRDHWHIFDFPESALKENTKAYVRRGVKEGLIVSRPPHVIVNAARRFAVYSNEFLLVPSRQVGIASSSEDQALLKALSLYLSSDFAFYHQFLTSTQFGVKRDVATLDALRAMPVPLTQLSHEKLAPWEDLHGRIVKESRVAGRRSCPADESKAQSSLFEDDTMDVLLAELNQMANRALGLNTREQALVHDLVRVRLALNDGKTGWAAVRPPTDDEMDVYGRCLRNELDAFIGRSVPKKHTVEIVHDELSGMVCVDLLPGRRRKVKVTSADRPTAGELADTRRRLLRRRSQWLYFNRNLRIYEGTRTYVLKPMQYFHWTESQAIFDAREIIAETLSAGESA